MQGHIHNTEHHNQEIQFIPTIGQIASIVQTEAQANHLDKKLENEDCVDGLVEGTQSLR
jgi:hypothetical protein